MLWKCIPRKSNLFLFTVKTSCQLFIVYNISTTLTFALNFNYILIFLLQIIVLKIWIFFTNSYHTFYHISTKFIVMILWFVLICKHLSKFLSVWRNIEFLAKKFIVCKMSSNLSWILFSPNENMADLFRFLYQWVFPWLF